MTPCTKRLFCMLYITVVSVFSTNFPIILMSLPLKHTSYEVHVRIDTILLSRTGHPNHHGIFSSPCRPLYVYTVFFVGKRRKQNIFQYTQFARKYPCDPLGLKLEEVHIMNFRLVLGMVRG